LLPGFSSQTFSRFSFAKIMYEGKRRLGGSRSDGGEHGCMMWDVDADFYPSCACPRPCPWPCAVCSLPWAFWELLRRVICKDSCFECHVSSKTSWQVRVVHVEEIHASINWYQAALMANSSLTQGVARCWAIEGCCWTVGAVVAPLVSHSQSHHPATRSQMTAKPSETYSKSRRDCQFFNARECD